MDPNETLERMRKISAWVGVSPSVPTAEPSIVREALSELVELFDGLDDWLSRGGFPPEAWREGPDAPEEPRTEAQKDWDAIRPDPLGPPDPPATRRVKVRWTTRDVREWEATFDVPDDVPDEEVEDYFTDGDCAELVEYDGDTHVQDGSMVEFNREVESLERVTPPARPERDDDYTPAAINRTND
jgi:hypothetical protein